MPFDKAFLLQHKKTILFFISCFFSLIVIYHSVNVLIGLYSEPSIHATPSQTAHKPSLHKPTKAMQAYPLFGDYVPKDSEKRNIPNTLLNLKLVGILKASNTSQSQAIIQIVGGEEKVYSVHSLLPGEAKIIKILDDYVLLSRQGKLERLTLTHPKLSSHQRPKPLEFKS